MKFCYLRMCKAFYEKDYVKVTIHRFIFVFGIVRDSPLIHILFGTTKLFTIYHDLVLYQL